jgi:hypothetical protein
MGFSGRTGDRLADRAAPTPKHVFRHVGCDPGDLDHLMTQRLDRFRVRQRRIGKIARGLHVSPAELFEGVDRD